MNYVLTMLSENHILQSDLHIPSRGVHRVGFQVFRVIRIRFFEFDFFLPNSKTDSIQIIKPIRIQIFEFGLNSNKFELQYVVLIS